MHKVSVSSIKEVLEDPEHSIELQYCHTDFQAADIFTKALPPHKWDNAMQLLGMAQSGSPSPSEVAVTDKPLPPVKSNQSSLPKSKKTAAVPSICEGICQACGDSIDGLAESELCSEEQVQYVIDECVKTIADICACSPSTVSAPSANLTGWGTLLEICTSPNSNLGVAASQFTDSKVTVIRVTESDDFSKRSCVDWVCTYLKEHPGASLHGSLPCTVWSAWQYMAIKRNGDKYLEKLQRRRAQSTQLLRSFIKCAELCMSLGGEVSFEWPRDCSGWQRPELIKFIHSNSLSTRSQLMVVHVA